MTPQVICFNLFSDLVIVSSIIFCCWTYLRNSVNPVIGRIFDGVGRKDDYVEGGRGMEKMVGGISHRVVNENNMKTRS